MILARHMRKSVQLSTEKGYSSGWEHWLKYLDTLAPVNNPGVFFEKVRGTKDRQSRLALFYVYLYELGKREEQIVRVSSAVRFHMEAHQYDTSFFDGVVAKRSRMASGRSNDEKRQQRIKQAETKILPIGLDIVRELREELWVNTSWKSKEGLDKKGTWISIGLGYDGGNRVSNVTGKDGSNASDHSLKTEDIVFHVTNAFTRREATVKGVEALRDALQVSGAEVKFASIHYWTSKTASKSLTLDHMTAVPLLKDLVEWICKSGAKPGECVCSRYWNGRKRTVTSKDVRYAIKHACLRNGLPAERYSSKSLRSGFATHYTLCNGDTKERDASGGWAEGSSVPAAHYDFAPLKGALSLNSKSQGLSIDDMRIMAVK